MYCFKCGKLNVAEAAFCYNCGVRLLRSGDSAADSEATPPLAPVPPEAKPDEATVSQPVAATQEEVRPPAAQPAPPPVVPPILVGQPPQYQGQPPTYPGQPPVYPGGQPSNQSPNYPGGQPPLYPGQAPYGSYPPRYGNVPYQDGRVPVAPNGKPYIVADNPDAFFAYKKKEGQQVYTAFAPLSFRFLAAVIDTFLMSLVNTAVLALYLLATNNLQVLVDAIRGSDTVALQQTIVPDWLNLFNNTLYLVYCTLMLWLSNGQTLGKKIFGIKVIRQDGSKLDFKTALLRSVFGFSIILGSVIAPYGTLFSLLWFGLLFMVIFGFTNAFRDKRRQGWHDKLAETVVVRAKELVQGVNF